MDQRVGQKAVKSYRAGARDRQREFSKWISFYQSVWERGMFHMALKV